MGGGQEGVREQKEEERRKMGSEKEKGGKVE